MPSEKRSAKDDAMAGLSKPSKRRKTIEVAPPSASSSSSTALPTPLSSDDESDSLSVVCPTTDEKRETILYRIANKEKVVDVKRTLFDTKVAVASLYKKKLVEAQQIQRDAEFDLKLAVGEVDDMKAELKEYDDELDLQKLEAVLKAKKQKSDELARMKSDADAEVCKAEDEVERRRRRV